MRYPYNIEQFQKVLVRRLRKGDKMLYENRENYAQCGVITLANITPLGNNNYLVSYELPEGAEVDSADSIHVSVKWNRRTPVITVYLYVAGNEEFFVLK